MRSCIWSVPRPSPPLPQSSFRARSPSDTHPHYTCCSGEGRCTEEAGPPRVHSSHSGDVISVRVFRRPVPPPSLSCPPCRCPLLPSLSSSMHSRRRARMPAPPYRLPSERRHSPRCNDSTLPPAPSATAHGPLLSGGTFLLCHVGWSGGVGLTRRARLLLCPDLEFGGGRTLSCCALTDPLSMILHTCCMKIMYTAALLLSRGVSRVCTGPVMCLWGLCVGMCV